MLQAVEWQSAQLLFPVPEIWLLKAGLERRDVGCSARQKKNGGRRLLHNGENLVAFGARKTAQSMHVSILV